MPSYPPDFELKYLWFVKIDLAMLSDPTYITALPIMIIMEGLVYVLAALTFYHAYKTHGLWKACLFFAGSFVYTGLEENMWIFSGYLGNGLLLGAPLLPVAKTYYFAYNKALLWFFGVPVMACLGWFFIAYGTFYIAEQFFKDWQESTRSLIIAAAIAGGLAVNMDLMIDPFMVRNGSWFWLSTQYQNFYVLGIPITNFIGWFLLIFLFAIFWTKVTQLEERFGKLKTTFIFFGGLFGLLYGTLYLLVLIGFALTPLYYLGINISIPGLFGVI
ncbi:MAG: carotenoid biosynthesis protein [Candidatus Helarchaeales archaeon]